MREEKVIARLQRAGVGLGAFVRTPRRREPRAAAAHCGSAAADLRSGLREPARGMVPHVLFE